MLLCLAAVRPLAAQCRDGSPPPCAAPVTRAPAAPLVIDANRIAVIPFRVSSADSLLGEGLAELAANEFTGEGSPRAVDMATVVGTWRRAGGGLRTPLTLDASRRIARDMGAGLLVEGSIVGLGGALTLSASVIRTPDGSTRGAPVRVTAPADSLDVLLRRAAAGLLVAAGGQARAETGARISENSGAVREYLQGLAAWRRGRLDEATAAFDRAIEADSSFAQALFSRYLALSWGFAQRGEVITRLAWANRARLSRQQRIVLEAVLGSNYPAPRLVEQRLADLRAAATHLPDSPEALYYYGDNAYHRGAAVIADHLTIAREYLERATAVDSQAILLRHLVEVGIRLRDTSLLRRAAPAFSRTEAFGRWCFAFLAAAERGDAQALSAVRSTPPADDFACRAEAALGSLPAALIDDMFARLANARPEPERPGIVAEHGRVIATRGRPAAAERVWNRTPSAAADLARLDLTAAGFAGLDIAGAVTRAQLVARDTGEAARAAACGITAVRIAVSAGAVPPIAGADAVPACAALAQWERAIRDGWSDSTLHVLDSLNRNGQTINTPRWQSFVLAVVWEKRGQPRRALSALRSRSHGGQADDQRLLRDEGRLALVVGDTAAGVRAWRMFLETTVDAEPPVQAVRDSVRVALDAIQRLQPRR